MSFLIPEPDIIIGVDDFTSDKNLLGTPPLASQISSMISNVDTKMVLALDGAWGSGKSVFLKFWVAHHEKIGTGCNVIYIDAFAQDYMQDALSMIMIAITEEIEKSSLSNAVNDNPLNQDEPKYKKPLKALKAVAPRLTRIGVGILTAGATEIIGIKDENWDNFFDKVTETASAEISDELTKSSPEILSSIESYWQEQKLQKKAILAFRHVLKSLIQSLPQKKLVIIIDELDRCRPDFALDILEITKHLLSVDGLSVIYGTNMKELAKMVQARYGANADGARYLKKFIDVQVSMATEKYSKYVPKNSPAVYFDKLIKQRHTNPNYLFEYIDLLIGGAIKSNAYEYRDMKQLYAIARLIPNHDSWGDKNYLPTALIALRALRPNLARDAVNQNLDLNGVRDFFDFDLLTNIRLKDASKQFETNMKYLFGLSYVGNPEFDVMHTSPKLNPKSELAKIMSRYLQINLT